MYIRYQSEASDTHWLSQRGRGGKRDELRHLRLSLWMRINNRMSRCTAIISSPPATKAQQTWCWSKAADKSSMAFWRFYQQHTDWTECWFVQQSSCSLKGHTLPLVALVPTTYSAYDEIMFRMCLCCPQHVYSSWQSAVLLPETRLNIQ